jgi:hypothetical protein
MELADLRSLVPRESLAGMPARQPLRATHAFDSPHVLTRLDQSGSDRQVAWGASTPTALAACREAGPTDPSCRPPRNQQGPLAGVRRTSALSLLQSSCRPEAPSDRFQVRFDTNACPPTRFACADRCHRESRCRGRIFRHEKKLPGLGVRVARRLVSKIESERSSDSLAKACFPQKTPTLPVTHSGLSSPFRRSGQA